MRTIKAISVCIVFMFASLTTAQARTPVPYSVFEVQAALNNAGFSAGTPDGIWGRKSSKAMTDFQNAKGLSATGILDDATRATLFPGQEAALNKPARPAVENTIAKQQSKAVVPDTVADASTVQIKPNSGGNTGTAQDSGSIAPLWIIGAIVILAFLGLRKRKSKG